MKSFATLCLLGVSLAVRLTNNDKDEPKEPRPCLPGATEVDLDEILGKFAEDVREAKVELPESEAEEAGRKIKEAVRGGATCE